MNTFLLLIHLLGLALALGAATVKLTLLLWCGTDPVLVAVFVRVAKPITRILLAGMGLLIISGGSWLALGWPFSSLLAVKLALVVAVLVLGPIIDKKAEPALARVAPPAESTSSATFLRARRGYVALEIAATALLGAITVLGVLL